VYSIAADVELDVYDHRIPDEEADEFSEVFHYRSGGESDVRDITEARRRVDSGDFGRGSQSSRIGAVRRVQELPPRYESEPRPD
jgi:hypothetical protein